MKILPEVNISRLFSHRATGLGLALSGGGAKGFAHIGVLMALEKNNLRPRVMAGVSAGSIVAVLYGAGLSPRDIVDCFASYSGWSDFTRLAMPRASLFSLDKFARIFESWLPVKRLEELHTPTYVCAADIEKGTSRAWTAGEITPRVMASCSVPIIFPPIRIEGNTYVDGGVLRNLPAWAIRSRCRTLLGSNCSPLDTSYTYRPTLLATAMRSYSLMSKANTLQDLLLCDSVVRHAGLTHVATFDMSDMRRTVLRGYDAACPVIESMLRGKHNHDIQP